MMMLSLMLDDTNGERDISIITLLRDISTTGIGHFGLVCGVVEVGSTKRQPRDRWIKRLMVRVGWWGGLSSVGSVEMVLILSKRYKVFVTTKTF